MSICIPLELFSQNYWLYGGIEKPSKSFSFSQKPKEINLSTCIRLVLVKYQFWSYLF